MTEERSKMILGHSHLASCRERLHEWITSSFRRYAFYVTATAGAARSRPNASFLLYSSLAVFVVLALGNAFLHVGSSELFWAYRASDEYNNLKVLRDAFPRPRNLVSGRER